MSETEITKTEAFKTAATDFEKIVKDHSPTNEETLEGYGLFKQGSFGDNTKPKPGFLTSPTEKAKWDAYEKYKGISTSQAQEQYVKFVEGLKKKYA